MFALLYPMMLSDFVSDNTRTGAGSATDQRPFTAAGKGADQGSAGPLCRLPSWQYCDDGLSWASCAAFARSCSLSVTCCAQAGPNRWAAAPSAT